MSTAELAPARIAVFHLNQVGDLVFSLPALAALRAGFPAARLISVLRAPLAPLLAGSGLVDEVITHEGSRDLVDTAQRLRGEAIDLAVCLSESPRSRLLAFLSRAPRRVGLDGGPLAGLLTERVEKVGLPSTDNDLRVVRALGCPVPSDSYVGLLSVGEDDRRAASRLLAEARGDGSGDDRLVVLAPEVSKGREAKAWPGDRFAEVARAVGARPGRVSVVVGSSPGAGLGDAGLGAGSADSEGFVDLGGRTDLRQLTGVLSLSSLFVGNDSGVLHLAACLGVPCVGLYGPTDPAETGPQGGPHRVLRAADGSMDELSTAEVIAAIDELFDEGGAPGSPPSGATRERID